MGMGAAGGGGNNDGGPPHNPVQNPNPPPAGVTAEDVLEAFDLFRAKLLSFIADSRTPAPPRTYPDAPPGLS